MAVIVRQITSGSGIETVPAANEGGMNIVRGEGREGILVILHV